MRKLTQIMTLIAGLLTGFGTAQAQTCSSSNAVEEPPVFNWTYHPVSADNPEPYYSGVLEFDSATFNIGSDTLTTRVYRQEGAPFSIPAPTIIMEPGNKYVLRFKNNLPYEAPNPAHNVFKNPNITNVHTHGLHISGETPSDDVTRMFEGGRGGDYVWDIPADHMGGTFWYHAHHHGSTFLQVSNGAFGMMVIDDANDGIPANVQAMTERHMVFGFLDPNAAGTGGDTLVGGTLAPTWTLNGKKDGDVCMPAGEWQHWRVLLADRDARLVDFSIGSECEMELMARDGVWRTTAPKTLTTNSIGLTGASRADIAVRCSGNSTISIGTGQEAQIIVEGTPDTTVHPFAEDGVSTWSADRPVYLRDLRSEAVAGSETVRMGARSINGQQFNKDVPTLTAIPDGVQRWNIKGAQNHPFHLHVYHVQMENDCTAFEAGEFYDVVAGSCLVRFDLDAANSSVYDGRTIMHCHILEHEDQGAMGWLDVQGGLPAPTFPQDASLAEPYSAYYVLDGGTGPTNQAPVASFSSDCTDLSCDFTDGSTDDTAVVSYDWDFGDGNTSTNQNPTHVYATAGTYNVTLTVADGEGLTDASNQDVTVSDQPTGGDFTLSASGAKVRGVKVNDLAWNGSSASSFDIYLDGVILDTVSGTSYTHNTGEKGGGSYSYQVCEQGTLTCSNTAVVTF